METRENYELLFLGSSNLRLCQIFIFMSRLPREYLHTMPRSSGNKPKIQIFDDRMHTARRPAKSKIEIKTYRHEDKHTFSTRFLPTTAADTSSLSYAGVHIDLAQFIGTFC